MPRMTGHDWLTFFKLHRINEHGEEYGNGIKPIFDAKKERRYDSAWNWTRQDCLVLYYDYACGRTRYAQLQGRHAADHAWFSLTR